MAPEPNKRHRFEHSETVQTTEALAPEALRSAGRFFRDAEGRVLHLRGVNVAPNAKTPANQPSHVGGPEFFDPEWQRSKASFVGQPFPVDEADEHFARLRRWGFNFLRFNITWEAIEHGGPGVYDMDYINYVVAILRKAKEHGFRCFIDPHQDVWSRWTGGDGAPMWTLDLAGFEPTNFNATGAAIVQNTYEGDKHDFPMMVWPTNYRKLAAATMFTLFWAGKTFAPKVLVDAPPAMGQKDKKVNIQDHLQTSFLRCMFLMTRAIVEAGLHDSCVIGYDTFNEPNEGLLGCTDIGKQLKGQTMRGTSPNPFETFCLGEGIKQEVEFWSLTFFGPRKTSTVVIDPAGKRAWKGGRDCIWKEHGVWTPSGPRGEPTILVKDYFSKHPATGQLINVEQDFVQPFFYRVAAVMRSAHPDAIILLEPRVMTPPPEYWNERAVVEYGATDEVARAAIFGGKDCDDKGALKETGLKIHFGDRRIAYTPHWYDGITLANKKFNPWFNVDALSFLRAHEEGKSIAMYSLVRLGAFYVRHVFADNVFRLAQDGWHALKGQVPVVFGEYGLPYDMMQKLAYQNGDYTLHEQALDAYFNAMEHTRLDTTLWNYCASNCNEWGDNWNGEDLSIYSLDVHPESDKGAPLDHGGRGLNAVCRPFAIAVAGTPLKTEFNMLAKQYQLEFEHRTDESDDVEEDGSGVVNSRTTEIFLPRWHYPSKADVLVHVSHGKWKIVEETGPSYGKGETDSTMKLVWDCGCPGPSSNGLAPDSIKTSGRLTPENTMGVDSDESAGLLASSSTSHVVHHSIVISRRGHKVKSNKWGVATGVGLAVLVVGLVYLGFQFASSTV